MNNEFDEVDSFGIPIEEESLLEMANAIQKYTGLPGVIYFCTKDEMKNPQAHALGRVKWLHAGKKAFVSIKRGKDGNRISGGDHRMIADLERFVDKNETLFWKYWNTPKDEADSAEAIKHLSTI